MSSREFVAASAEPLVLALLAEGENYGYEIIRQIAARSDQQLQWTEGMLYPVLHRLEQNKLIKSRWVVGETGRRRKYYSLRETGRQALTTHQHQWSLVQSIIGGLRKGSRV